MFCPRLTGIGTVGGIAAAGMLALSLQLSGCAEPAPRPVAGPRGRLAQFGPTWVEMDGVVYGARADQRGPIGGEPGYTEVVIGGDYTVRTIDELLAALAKARPGQVVFVPGDVALDCTARVFADKLAIKVPGGVTLAGDRGHNGSKGAKIYSDAFHTSPLIEAVGPNVRITGLRIIGPDPKPRLEHHYRGWSQPLWHAYYYKLPNSRGIFTRHARLEVDNCELSAWSHCAIALYGGRGHRVHHNYIHHCTRNGLGYGVCHTQAVSLVEQNLFDHNRHSIQGTGEPGCSYEARNNVELGYSLSHCFDMHGQKDPNDEDKPRMAGESVNIHHNTFLPSTQPIRYRARDPKYKSNATAVKLRGSPRHGATITRNWFAWAAEPYPEVLTVRGNCEVTDNAYGRPARAAPIPARVEVLSPIVADKPGRIRITFTNNGDKTVRDAYRLVLTPPIAARALRDDRLAFTLEPGQEYSREFAIHPAEGADVGGITAFFLREPGGIQPSAKQRSLWKSLVRRGMMRPQAPQLEERFTVLRVLGRRRIVVVPTPASLKAIGPALALQKPLRIRWDGAESAEVRLALAGRFLLVDAAAPDSHIRRADHVRNGSCVTIFASAKESSPIERVLLAPAVGKRPAVGFRLGESESPPPVPSIRIRSEAILGGYRMQAMVPLELLGILPSAAEMFLEFQVSRPDPRTRQRTHASYFTADTGADAGLDNSFYGHFTVPRDENPKP